MPRRANAPGPSPLDPQQQRVVALLRRDGGARNGHLEDRFRRHGRLVQRDADLFGTPSWLAVHIGQGNMPDATDPLLPLRGKDHADHLRKLEAALVRAAEGLPDQADYIAKNCAAS